MECWACLLRSRAGLRHTRSMDVFVSSVVSGYGAYREAAVEGIETLGHRASWAEEFAAAPGTPQQACLEAVRHSGVVVLLIGADYGAHQPSGLSATHEEYREARERKPVLVFVESGVEREPAQEQFLHEVQAWSAGHFRAAYSNAGELKRAVTRALHEHELATSAGSVDEDGLIARARELLPTPRGSTGHAALRVAVAAGPHQQVVRPAELEDPTLSRDLQQEALFGSHPVLELSEGTHVHTRGHQLLLEQPTASVIVDESGGVVISQPARRQTPDHGAALPSLIEEDVTEAASCAVRFVGSVLERLDPVHRLTDVVVAAQMLDSGYLPWRTRAEQQASPTRMSITGGGADCVVMLSPARRNRQALTHEAERIATDLTVLLRREHQA